MVYGVLVLFFFISANSLVDLPPGGKQALINNLVGNFETDIWEDLFLGAPLPRTFSEAKRAITEADQISADPYNIKFTQETNFTRISFDSLLYKDRRVTSPSRYMLMNTLPKKCTGQQNLPYVVFLTGYGASPEDYGIGLPFMNELIENGTLCCFHAFIPFFFILPTGGYWYTNNQATIPELYLFTEVLTVINRAMGDTVTKDPKMRILAGHSMGGYGAVMNGMRTNMQFFDSVCGLNGGLYIWNLPEFQENIAEKVVQEAISRKAGPFINCSYTQPPYRYYADDINFNTIVSTSLAAVFHSDGTTTPKDNSPYFSPTLFNPDCTGYGRFFGFRYWINDDGSLNSDMFNIAPWNSPLGFLELNYPSLQIELSNNLYLSTNYNDTIVDYLENERFSEELSKYNISHVFDKFYGTHYDVYDGIRGCLETFAPKICPAAPPVEPSNDLPTWAFYVSVGVAGVLVLTIVVLAVAYLRGRSRSGYASLPQRD